MSSDSMTMGSGGHSLVAFLLMWIFMIVIMMIPLSVPTILRFYRLVLQQVNPGQALILSGVFIVSYLLPWVIFGFIADLALWSGQINSQFAQYQPASVVVISLIAGLYQFTSLKTTCLGCHQSPLFCKSSFQNITVKEAFSMGIQHGSYCLGSCWGLMLVLLALDAMNWTVMGLVTAIIFAERMFHWHFPVRQITGLGLIGFGIWTTVRLMA